MLSALKILAILAVLYVLLATLAWKFQERLAFPGPRHRLPDPTAARIADGERVTVTTADSVELHGWYLPPSPAPSDGTDAPGLLWFYGNTETVAALAPIIRELRPPGTALLILDYRGYGESGSTPTEPGLYRDAEAAWDFLAARPKVNSNRIAAYGRSLGSAFALHVAMSRPVAALVLDSPFSSAIEMADLHYPFLPKFLVRLSMDNVSRARSLDIPLLVFHGSEDRVAPLSMGRAVTEASGDGRLVVIDGAGHNETYNMRRYRATFHEFLAASLR